MLLRHAAQKGAGAAREGAAEKAKGRAEREPPRKGRAHAAGERGSSHRGPQGKARRRSAERSRGEGQRGAHQGEAQGQWSRGPASPAAYFRPAAVRSCQATSVCNAQLTTL